MTTGVSEDSANAEERESMDEVRKVLRVMTPAGDCPKCGRGGRLLGVRLPPNGKPDIHPDQNGEVHPGTGGMSVSPTLSTLPSFCVPARLKPFARNARGKNTDRVWRLSDAPFEDGELSNDLRLAVDSNKHATIQPKSTQSTSDYEQALESTREEWLVDEPVMES